MTKPSDPRNLILAQRRLIALPVLTAVYLWWSYSLDHDLTHAAIFLAVVSLLVVGSYCRYRRLHRQRGLEFIGDKHRCPDLSP